MALNQTNKLVWIVETIYKARKITFEDLNRQWMDNIDLSGGEELLKRTFHKWKWNIFDTFGLMIECEKAAPYRYYIDNVDDMRRGSIESWLLSTYSVSNSLAENKSIKDRILLEDVPSGREYLDPILEAMKKNRFIHIAYYNYWREDLREHYIMPLCVKLFRQRWYVVGRQWPSGNDSIYCLDRIRDFRLSSHSFEYPKDFIPQEYFAGCFGIIADKDCDIQKVRLKVGSGQANYLRDLPLHESQQETERAEEYSIFEYRLRPTFDFQQEILWNGEDMERIEREGRLDEWCADDIMTRLRLKSYQDTYAEAMAKYGLQRGIDGSKARHKSTQQYYNETKKLADSLKAEVVDLQRQKETAQEELRRTKKEIQTEKLKGAATTAAANIAESVGSLFGSNKVKTPERENAALHREVATHGEAIEALQTRIQTMQNDHHRERMELEAKNLSELSRKEAAHTEETTRLKNRILWQNHIIGCLSFLLLKTSDIFRKAVHGIIRLARDYYKPRFDTEQVSDIKSVLNLFGDDKQSHRAAGDFLYITATQKGKLDNREQIKARREVDNVVEGRYDQQQKRGFSMRR